MPIVNRTFVIRHFHDDQLFWNERLGWVEAGQKDYFHEDDYERLSYAVDGKWCCHVEPK